MATDSLALLSEAEKLARVTDAITGRYALELSRVLRDLERELRRLALESLDGRQTALAKAVRAAKLRRQIQQALKASGYPQLAEVATHRSLDVLVAQVEQLRGAANLSAFVTSDLSRILALKELALIDVLGQGDEMAIALWRTFMRGLFASASVNEILDDLAQALDLELFQARTLYDTTVSVFGRQVELMKSTPEDVFVYLGPLDRKTRPFCYERVGKVFTREEIDGWDNGQNMPGPPFLTCGGYNCRHTPVSVSKVSALRQLVGTDQRMPEVESRLQTLDKGDRKAA
jgi:hypothetical protein